MLTEKDTNIIADAIRDSYKDTSNMKAPIINVQGRVYNAAVRHTAIKIAESIMKNTPKDSFNVAKFLLRAGVDIEV